MRRVKVMGTALVAALAMSAIAVSTASAASKLLTLGAYEVEGSVISEGANIEGTGDVHFAFKLKNQAARCDLEFGGLGFHFQGTLASNKELMDRLIITNPRTEEMECEFARGMEANLYPENPPWTITVSSKGKAELTGQSGELKMLLQIYVYGEEAHELLCHFHRPALKGTNDATASEQPLTFAFREKSGANKLSLNQAASAPGCPKSMKFGLETSRPQPEFGIPIHCCEGHTIVERTQRAEPGFSIEKLQEIAGSGAGFTKSKLSGVVGETVDYEVIVTNRGNAPLRLSPLVDEHCDPATITGGPGENLLAPEGQGSTSTYRCQHVLTLQDLTAGSYSNSGTDTGTMPGAQGSAITHTSNLVVVEVRSH